MPAEPLKKYIHQYWYLSTDDAREFGNLTQMMFPLDFGGLSFYYSESLPLIQHYKNNIEKQVSALYTGLITSPGSISFEPNIPIEGFVVAFLPHGFAELFGTDVSGTTDQLPDFFEMSSDEGRQLYADVKNAVDFESKMNVANNFFLPKVPKSSNSTQILDAVMKIVATNGLIDMKQLANEVNMSWKTLERHFNSKVGVSPKMYARFKRFHHALQMLNEQSPGTWSEIAEACGYYDQAHFIKEFRTFTNQNPTAFSVMDYPLFYRFIIEKK